MIQFPQFRPAKPERLPQTASSRPTREFQLLPSLSKDTVQFSGQAQKSRIPYTVEQPSTQDRYSLGLAQEIGAILKDILKKEYLENGRLDAALKNIEEMPHQLSSQAEYRKKYEPVLELYRILGEQGYAGLNAPAQYGGSDADTLSLVELSKQLAYADLGACTTILASIGLFGEPILDIGTEEQKLKYLPPVLTGEKIGAFGLTETQAGSDPGALKTTAKATIGPDGKRQWTLNGSKIFISNGNLADYAVILARTIDETGKDRGISAFVVEHGDAGYSTADAGKKVGLHTSDTAELFLDDVVVDDDRLVGGEAGIGRGKHIYNNTLTGGRIGVGAQGIGLAERALDEMVEYAKNRKQGGVSIASYPELREMVAKVALQNEVSKVLAYHAARTKDAGEPYKKLASMTKLMGTEMAAKDATDTAIQVLGGMGFMEESKVGKLWRDARVLRIYEGTSQIQKLIIAGEILTEVMKDSSLMDKPTAPPKDLFEVVDQAFSFALNAAQPKFLSQFMALGHPMKAMNAAQPYGYRLALIATEREALLALKDHTERLKTAGLPSEKEETMLRLYSREVAKRALDLANEVGVPPEENLRRLDEVRQWVDHPKATSIQDLEKLAKDILGPSQLPSAPEEE